MNPTGRNYMRSTASVVIVLVCLALVAAFAFSQGKAYAERKAEIQAFNDAAFYSLVALKALNEPQNESWRPWFQTGLEDSAMRLSQMCLKHPELIERKRYNLLVQVKKYLTDYGADPNRSPHLRPLSEIQAEIGAALSKLESLHNLGEWQEERGTTNISPIFK